MYNVCGLSQSSTLDDSPGRASAWPAVSINEEVIRMSLQGGEAVVRITIYRKERQRFPHHLDCLSRKVYLIEAWLYITRQYLYR